ncbi:carboxypeptidase-like regulatory domain-containing protein [Chryseobacterium sp. PBS4-4]|uniref:Carboxypeptidase-like regulatory domain-containing protein n=1 Tax=Chryseobacterium edaphi TaxID=2976532 RepID=A0ABT2W9Y5_9FLAO|nr:carboxypeptidase-like regulatory domain-containing protein [Chryseobacterium edaphi]MCU7619017.1 carboxypeptidase-like regulatory domain-containing protein [Chryseobacterium edaphi]
MKAYINILILLITFFSFTSCSEELVDQAQTGVLRGKVVKKGTNQPIVNAKVFTTPSTQTTFSDKDGMFEIKDIPAGNYSVKAELSGYISSFQAVNIQNENQVVTIVFEMDDDDSLNSPPSAPTLLSPIDNAVNQPLSVQLSWNATDPDKTDSLTYKLTVKNNINTNIIQVNDLKVKTYTLSNLQFGVSYFWQISVSDGIHSDVLSPVFKFTTSTTPANRYHYVRKQNGNFIIMSSDVQGNSFQLTNVSNSSWRPRKNNNAGLIAFLRNDAGGSHIFTANPDGSNIFKVTQIPVAGFNQDELDFSWNTSGSAFLYSNFDKLYKINKDGTGQQLIYTTPDGSLISEVDWSYDNSKIAVKTNNFSGYNTKIFIIDMLGNVLQNVFSASTGATGGLNFSIDGQKLLYTHDVSGYQDSNYRQLDSHIFIYNLVNNTMIDASLQSDKPIGTNDLDPRFSPNNSQIIMVNTSNDNVSQKNIMAIDLNNTGVDFTRAILFSNGEMPDFE